MITKRTAAVGAAGLLTAAITGVVIGAAMLGGEQQPQEVRIVQETASPTPEPTGTPAPAPSPTTAPPAPSPTPSKARPVPACTDLLNPNSGCTTARSTRSSTARPAPTPSGNQ